MSMKFHIAFLATIALLTWSPEARASDPSGLAYVLAIVGIGAPFLIGSAFATISAAFKGRYELRPYAVNHVLISSAFLVLGIFAFLIGFFSGKSAPHGVETAIFAGALIGIPAFFIVAPWLLHIWQRERHDRPRNPGVTDESGEPTSNA